MRKDGQSRSRTKIELRPWKCGVGEKCWEFHGGSTGQTSLSLKNLMWKENSLPKSLTAALDQLRVVASSTSNDPGSRSRQHQQIGQCLLPLAAANFSVDDPAGASSQQREECRCGLLLTVAVPAKQVYSPVGDRCDQIMNDVCQQ